ncbi:unnamed protein product [Allacma fusca]|uniref:Uncharacterized protein n=1 Tax=Allacma fusca TaxID=39272 RepID=A0A8J2JMY1_9HEXA|nr:unnamed protein product [Allacma fusca]
MSGFGQIVEDLRDAVFSNDLFWRLLGKHLNFGDLKVCRLVSVNFNRKVLDETNFRSRGVIKLSKSLLQPNAFGRTMEKWKNVHIKCFAWCPQSVPLIDLTWMYSHLSDVEELYISADINFNDGSDFLPPLHKVLEAVKSLKTLSLDQGFLNQTDVSVQMSSSRAVEDTLGNLTELELIASHGRPTFAAFPGKSGKWMDHLAQTLNKLTVLGTDGFVPQDNLEFPEEVDEELHPKIQNLLRLIEGNHSHLMSLQLDDMQLWSTSSDSSLQSLTRKVFPRLKSVKIRMSRNESQNLMSFLRHHPLLRDIDVTVFDLLPADLLNVIMERKELRRLSIKTKAFGNKSNTAWGRLSELNNLEVFSVNLVPSYRFATYSELLPSCLVHLPQSVKKIHLKGVDGYTVWNQIETIITPESLSNLNPAHLTELCISKCGPCVNDDVLEFVFRTFRFLRVLNISNTENKCTDYGFIGRPLKRNSSPFSISDLLGLRYLTLRSCGIITDETLIHGFKFMELCYLDISNNALMTQEGWRAVLAQNPSLEILKTSELEPFEKEDELKRLYPRLKEHQFSDGGDSDDDDSSGNYPNVLGDVDFGNGMYCEYFDDSESDSDDFMKEYDYDVVQ